MRRTAIAITLAVALVSIAVIALSLLVVPPAYRWARARADAVAVVEPLSLGGASALRSTVRMKRPRPKRCLTPTAVDLEGEEMAMAQVGDGLEGAQISAAVQPFHSFLANCQPVDGDDHSGTVVFGIQVGCNGVVQGVELVDDELYEPEMIDCLSERLTYVEFPAHDLADGMYFEYPLIFHPPG